MKARSVVLIVLVLAMAIAGCGQDTTNPAAMTAFATDLVGAVNSRDPATLQEFACPDVTESTSAAISGAGLVESARIVNVGEATSGTTKVRAALTGVNGAVTSYDLVINLEGDRPCWHDIVAVEVASATPSANPDIGQGKPFVMKVLRALKAGDAGKATDFLCPDSGSQRDIRTLADQRAQLRLDPDWIEDQADYFAADLLGEVNGRPISAGRISVFLEADGWCVHTVYAL